MRRSSRRTGIFCIEEPATLRKHMNRKADESPRPPDSRGYVADRIWLPSNASYDQQQYDRADKRRDDGADNAATDGNTQGAK